MRAAQRHAEADRKAVAERAGRGLDARNLAGLGMAAQDRVAVAEGVERLEREEALVGQHGVEREAAVALAQDHAVAIAPLRLVRGR